MTTPGKQTIYVDVDDEITTIIDKMNSTDARVIALVLPKRASVFQSIVNMKLLKRRADSAKKHLVLITSEAGLLPLAGAVGIHVAPTLQSKPEIPAAPAQSDTPEEIDEAVSLGNDEPARDAQNMSIGALAASHAPGINDLADDVVEIDNAPKKIHDKNPLVSGQQPSRELAAAAAAPKVGHNDSKKGKKKFSIPNFLSFRKWVVLGVLALIVFIILLFVAFKVLPSAAITIKTNTTSVNAEAQATLDTTATSVDTDQGTVPAQIQQQQKAYTASVPATGQKNLGNKATGSVTMTAQACAPNLGTPDSLPAGTGISANGLTFITQEAASFSFAGFSGGSCANYKSSPIDITAQQAGSQYNVNGASFTVSSDSNISASGSTTGGTDNIVKVVQQSDIDSAKQKLNIDGDKSNMQQQLQHNLENAGLYALTTTFTAKASPATSSANVDDQATNITVTENVTYTMYGTKQSDLKKVIDASVNKQIDTTKQSIQDDGLSGADIAVPTPGSGNQLKINISSTATVGPHLDVDQLKQEAAGKKSGQVKSLIKNNPGVLDVQVKYSPFWVTSAPSANKITVQFQKTSGNDNNQ